MESKDVTDVEYSRLLKRSGLPQDTQAYWQGIIPSLATIQGMSAIATEDKGKFRWLLVLGKPPEPSASAFTLTELQDYLKGYMEGQVKEHKFEPLKKREFPQVRKEKDSYICSLGGKDMFNAKNEVNAFAQAVLHIIKI